MFLNATMIAGLAAAALPLFLHYLQRSKLQRVEWGAMLFLDASGDAQRISAAWREWTLMLIRMAIIASLAFALAQPVSSGASDDQRAGVTVIIIDRSESMTVDAGGKTRMDLARRAALRILSALPSGDGAAVVFAPESFGSLITSDLQQVATRINDVRQSNSRADLAAAMNATARLLQTSRAIRRNVFLISDRQAISWRGMTSAFADAWRSQVSTAGMPALAFVPIGTSADNCCILSAEETETPAIVGRPFTIEIRIANFSSRDRSNVPLTLTSGPTTLSRSTVDLPAKKTSAIRQVVLLATAGSQLINARLGEDALLADDGLDLAVTAATKESPSRGLIDQNLNIGEPITADIVGALSEPINMEGPTNGSVEVVKNAEGIQARFSATNRSGIYRLHYQTAAGPTVLHFVVRPNREESDLTDTNTSDLARSLQQFGFKSLADPTVADVSTILNPTSVEPWLILLCITVSFSLMELILVRRWLSPVEAVA